MPEKTWKAVERAVAARLNGRRVPVTGRSRGDAPDVDHDWLAIEIKHRTRLPAWIEDALRQAEAAAREDQLPVAILHQKGRDHGKDLVVLRLADFEAWLGSAGG
ncbi:hypothetical protein GQ464_008840 [Rhodocaloribacter litoris]|uniref:hypothetical protein n=1 Tax=Rhodocaloribacter litoris TaxID=2558931 RepID=UPI001422251C|nr:hypothetical protein [Rhodocaloribacter litoris]QXD17021.1 hypothetical protein GQ464_008840 [Rhodocaloribacter litoris]